MRPIWNAIVAIGCVAGVGLVAWPAKSTGLLPYRDAAVTERGEVLYSENCAACHGSALQGQPDWKLRDAEGFLPAPPHDETGHTWHHPDAQLIEITRLGTERIVGGGYQSRMIGFQDRLNVDEIVAVLAYIKSTWPPEIIDAHNRVNDQADGS